MTFLENLEPLLKAAEFYAQATDNLPIGAHYPVKNAKSLAALQVQEDAAKALLAAAIEFSKWGK